MEQVRKQKQKDRQEPEQEEVEVVHTDETDMSITDDLLDEIDSVLESNAQEFVRSYVQKGGQ